EKNLSSDKKLIVIASNPFVYLFVKAISNDKVEIKLLESSHEVHEQVLSPKDYEEIEKADLIFYYSPIIEPELEKIKSASNTKSKFIALEPEEEITHEDNSNADIHKWLVVNNVKKYITLIKEKLVENDQRNKDLYINNSESAYKALDDLESLIHIKLKNCSKRQILTSHKYLENFCKEYNCTNYYVLGMHSHESEVTPQSYNQLLALVKSENIKNMVIDSSDNSSLINNFVKEANLNVKHINTFHSSNILTTVCKDLSAIDCYISIMKNNIDVIAELMQCSEQGRVS
ncbi:MAG: metal ABC transporter substrate-binding protein, partial [Candidatus Anstonellales archaeon]